MLQSYLLHNGIPTAKHNLTIAFKELHQARQNAAEVRLDECRSH